MRYILLLSLIFLESLYCSAQKEDSLVFSKGRTLTSLFGTLSNQRIDVVSSGGIDITGYTIGTKSGGFIKDNWVLGLNFSLSKAKYVDEKVSIDSEDLLLGLWSRLYFAKKGSAALYAEITPYYTGIFRQSIIRDNGGTILAHEEVSGSGFGVNPGFGFTYIITRNIGFGITISNSFARINVDTEELILANIVSDTYNVSQLQFSFNFQVYLDQFFF